MEYPFYEMTVPVFTRSLAALKGILKKGEEFAKQNGKSEEEFLNAKLAPDMFPLLRQVQIASDNAKGTSSRIAGIEAPKMEDNEKTFADLCERIDKTLAYLATLKPEQFKNSGEQQVKLPYFPNKHFIGREFVPAYGIPNFFFHLVTAYDILRHLGVQLGKADYIGGFPVYDD